MKTVVTTQVGDLLGFPKSLHHELRGEAREEDGAAVEPAGRRSPCPPRSRRARGTGLDEPPLGHDDIAFLQYTGGTTGVSKGAMLTHGNIVANLQQTSAWIGRGPRGGQGDRHHGAAAVPHLRAHRQLPHLHEDRRPQRPHHQSARHAGLRDGARASTASRRSPGVNTLFNALLNTPGFAELDFSTPASCRWAAAWRCSARWPSAGSR